jgi:hypothetical protein
VAGREILRKAGETDHIDLEPGEVRRLRHAVITHNHPGAPGVSFSLADVQLAALAVACEVRVTTARVTYSLRPPPAGWSLDWATRRLVPTYSEERRSLIPSMLDRIRRGEISRELATVATIDETWRRVAGRLRLSYGLEVEAAE